MRQVDCEPGPDGNQRGVSSESARGHSAGSVPAMRQIYAMIGDWGVMQANGDHLELTARGEALLESADPADVSDWLLTRILGVDNILHHLLAGGATREQLRTLLKKVNPGWVANFTPDNPAMRHWGTSTLNRSSPLSDRRI